MTSPCTAAIPPTTNTATPTVPSTTRPTSPSSSSSVGAAVWDDLPAAHAAAIAVRPAGGRAAVPARPPRARAGTRDRARLRVGVLPVHAVCPGEQLQRLARGGARARRFARCLLATGPWSVRRARRPHKVRPARACPTALDARPRRVFAPRRRVRAVALVRARLRGRPLAVVSIPALTHDSLHTIYERTLAYQSQPRIALLDMGSVRRPPRSNTSRRRSRAPRSRLPCRSRSCLAAPISSVWRRPPPPC